MTPTTTPACRSTAAGHLWVFVSGRGRKRPGHIYRSRLPYDITTLEHIAEREFTYPQPWTIGEQGFALLLTKYTGVRELYWRTSDPAGTTWNEDRKLAGMGGHYQVSNERKAVKSSPPSTCTPGGNVDKRTNLYFLQTSDRGNTWRTADGQTIEPPLTEPACPALVRDYRAEQRLVYMKDIGFDAGLARHPLHDQRPSPARPGRLPANLDPRPLVRLRPGSFAT
jgi:hypothetical protein